MNRLSVVMITRNADRTVERSLNSVSRLAGEIIVVDSGSSDRTLEIAAACGARVLSREWEGFGRQKNFGIRQAAHDWVLSLDADEVVTDELAAEITALPDIPPCDGYRIPRLNYYFGRPLRHGGQYPDYQLRLFRKTRGMFDTRPVHESAQVAGKVGKLRGDLHHYTYDTLDDYLEKFMRYTALEADRLYEAGVRPTPASALARMVLRPGSKFVRRYLFKLGFLDGVPGLIAAAFGSFTMAVSYARCWEKHRQSAADSQ